MRKLKVRFVDAGDGTVYKPITLVELCQRIEIPRRIVLESENGDFVGTDDFLDQFEKGELIIDPYTGLKDKNGKEIYEGDILASNFSTVYKVSYSEPNAGFEMWSEDGCGGKITDDQNTDDFEIEVIGNIHENKELLG